MKLGTQIHVGPTREPENFFASKVESVRNKWSQTTLPYNSWRASRKFGCCAEAELSEAPSVCFRPCGQA